MANAKQKEKEKRKDNPRYYRERVGRWKRGGDLIGRAVWGLQV